ncbi:MAG: BTAD domain-containing putative transcriptional regulator [Dermatophilaceae bacterium]
MSKNLVVTGQSQLQLLGRFALDVDGVPVDVSGRDQRLIAFLAIQGPQTRPVVAGRLWPDSTDERALSSVRSAVMHIRRTSGGILDVRRSTLALQASVDTDIGRLTAYLDEVEGADDGVSHDAREAVRSLRVQDLLPGWYADWVLETRDHLHRRQIRALISVAQAALDGGRPDLAIVLAEQAEALEPLLESTQRLVIRAHLVSGNPAAAIRQYRDYDRRLRQELGIRPSEALSSLVRGTGFVLARRPARA